MNGSLDGGSYKSSTTNKATYTTAPMSNSYYQLTVTAGLESITLTTPGAILTTAETTSTTSVETTQSTGGAAGHAGALITAAPMVAAAVAALL